MSFFCVQIYSSSDPYARAAMTRELNCLKALSKEMKKTGVVAGVAEILSEGESVVGGNRVQFIVTRRVLQFPQRKSTINNYWRPFQGNYVDSNSL